VPAVLRYPSTTALELVLPASDNEYPAPRPETIAWPNAIMTLNLISAEEMAPKPQPALKLGTSLKNVAISILKEVKKLAIAVLRSPTGAPINGSTSEPKMMAGKKDRKVAAKAAATRLLQLPSNDSKKPPFIGVLRLWTVRIEFELNVDPFFTLLHLKTGLTKLSHRYPALMPGNELASMTFLAQAMEDEKDMRLRDRL
jgi:hypothetical protein